MKNIHFSFRHLMFFFILISIVSCKKDEETTGIDTDVTKLSGNIAREWMDLNANLVKKTKGYAPPIAARTFGYVGLTMYEVAIQGYDKSYSLQGQLNGLSSLPAASGDYNWALVFNTAVAEITYLLFAPTGTEENLVTIAQLKEKIKKEYADEDPSIIEQSEAYGKTLADAIFEYSKSDGGFEAQLDPFQQPFTMPVGDSIWIPTGSTLKPLCPKWGTNRTFLASDINFGIAPAPVPFSTDPASAMYQEAKAVYNQDKYNTQDQIAIAKFWADDAGATATPPGHSILITSQLLVEKNANLLQSGIAFGLMGIALNDAFICCWKTKFNYNLLRPVTYIQRYIDPSFTTILNTPPFPAYTSGHSSQMGAATEIFVKLFARNTAGDYSFVDFTKQQYGFTIRFFDNFREMADECANSRLYGGIHYPMDNTTGLQMGSQIGNNILNSVNYPKVF